MDQITIEDKIFRADRIPLDGSAILVIQGGKGFLGCGYLSLETAEKLGHALAVVTGVSDYGQMLAAKVVRLSSKAQALGVQVGMTGRDALLKMS
jgi:uncharacterized protein YunC (DUF1805 family)